VSLLTALARAQAREAGRAQPLTTVRHTHVSQRPLVLIPLSLAGEAAAPLAVLAGCAPDQPRLLVVPNPRDRTQRFAFVAELAGVVLPYIDSHLRCVELVGKTMRYADAPQLLVPNQGGVEFLRLLGRSTRFRRTYGPNPVPRTVPLLGRWLTFLRDRADHAGSAMLLAVTDVLAAHWATGQSGLEDSNLAALLGWIDPTDGLDGPAAAAIAEDPVLFPPAGPSTDPSFDNEILAPALAGVAKGADPRGLTAAIEGQLTPTWRLMWRAVELLRALPEGASVAARWAADRDAFSAYAASLVDGAALPQPRVDSAVAAAGRLDRLERDQARYDAQRALDDPLVMAEFRLVGEAFAGRVVAADPRRRDTSGKRPVLRPHISVHTDDPVRVEPGATLVSPLRPAQTATVVSVSWPVVVLELAGGMGRTLTPPSGSVPEVGEAVTYGPASDAYQPPGRFPAREETPWTHGGPPTPYIPTDGDAGEDWS